MIGRSSYYLRMKIIRKDIIAKAIKRNADSRSSLKSWLVEVEKAEWKSFQAIKKRFASASLIRDGLVIFNIGGNKTMLELLVATAVCAGIATIALKQT